MFILRQNRIRINKIKPTRRTTRSGAEKGKKRNKKDQRGRGAGIGDRKNAVIFSFKEKVCGNLFFLLPFFDRKIDEIQVSVQCNFANDPSN